MPTPIIEIRDLYKIYNPGENEVRALDGVSLEVFEGEFVAIVGRSGNGKSTLINMVAGLVRPSSGTVHVDGREVTELSDKELSLLRNRTIGFVPQSQTLLGNLTVLDNVILPATMFPDALPFMEAENKDDAAAQKQNSTAETVPGIESEADNDSASDENSTESSTEPDPFMPDVIAPITGTDQSLYSALGQPDVLTERAKHLLTQLGAADLVDSYPRELSGGEMRRVSIARALMNQPKLLIADEPTGDLDQESTDIVMQLLRSQADNGTAILMVTHDSDALEYADKVYRMDAGVLSMAAV